MFGFEIAHMVLYLLRNVRTSTMFGAESSTPIRAIMLVSTLFTFHSRFTFSLSWLFRATTSLLFTIIRRFASQPMLARTMIGGKHLRAVVVGLEPTVAFATDYLLHWFPIVVWTISSSHFWEHPL